MIYLIIALLIGPCFPYAVNFLTSSPQTLQGGMYPSYSVFTFTADWGLASPSNNPTSGASENYGIAIGVVGTTPISGTTPVWNPTSTSLNNFGSTLTVLQSTSSILPQVSCQLVVNVDANDATVLRITLLDGCSVKVGSVVQVTVPWTVISPNPMRFTTVTLQMFTYYATINNNNAWVYTKDATVPVSTILLPYSTSETALEVNQLRFYFAMPSITTVDKQPSFWRFWFTPGITLRSISGSNAFIYIESNLLIFVANPPRDLTFAVGNCTASTAVTRSIGSNSRNAVKAVLTITLAPVECVLTANVPVQFDVPQGYLASIPTSGAQIQMRMATNQEPSVQLVQGFVRTGTSSVQSFKAVVPSTTQTLATPSLTFIYTLNTALVNQDRIVIRTTNGVFRPYAKNVAVIFSSPVSSSAACTGTGSTFEESIYVTPVPGCIANMNGGSSWNMTIPQDALLPNQPVGTKVAFGLTTDEDLASTVLMEAYTITGGCSLGSVSGASIASASGVKDLFSTFSVQQRSELVSFMTQISPNSNGVLACDNLDPNVWFFKVRESAVAQTISSPDAPVVLITNWGFMRTTPVFAIAITYPVTSKMWDQIVKLQPGLNSLEQVAFLVRIERMLSSGQVFNLGNPIEFEVFGLKREVTNVYVHAADADAIPVQGDIGQWAQSRSGNVIVYCTFGPLFIGLQKVVPIPGSNSDAAWFGLLALIALPLLCLCLLAALAWYFWSKRSCACACNFPCPMQQGCSMVPQEFSYPQTCPASYPLPYW